MSAMKTTILYSSIVAIALAAGPVIAAEEKTLGERTADTVGKAAEKTKEAGRAAVDATKRAATSVKDAVVTPDEDARKVEVTLTDHRIDMPRSIPAGKTAFIVTNSGKAKHNFEIEGQGIEKKFFASVDPNESKTLQLNLKPGNYKVFCPMEDHEGKGMETTLTVK